MNITTILLQILQALPTMVPSALALFNDPQFQAVLKQIEALFNQQVAAGVTPAAAANQAAGLAFSATALHLTGNPVADFNSWVASLHPPVVTAPTTVAKFP
jgi:Mn-containing catalase